MRLPLASKALAPLLWLIASESKSETGEFDASPAELEFRLHMSTKDIEAGLQPLLIAGFFVDASNPIADGLQLASQRRVETETETETEGVNESSGSDGFETFYRAYPRRAARKDAERAFNKAKLGSNGLAVVLSDIQRRLNSGEWLTTKTQFIPLPASYLNGRRWEDEVPVGSQAASKPWEGAL
jgi:hypothetical protein